MDSFVYIVAILLVLPVVFVAALIKKKYDTLHLTLFIVGLCQLVMGLSALIDPSVVSELGKKHELSGLEELYWTSRVFAAVPLMIPMEWLRFAGYRRLAYALISMSSTALTVLDTWKLVLGRSLLSFLATFYITIMPLVAFIYCAHKYSLLKDQLEKKLDEE